MGSGGNCRIKRRRIFEAEDVSALDVRAVVLESAHASERLRKRQTGRLERNLRARASGAERNEAKRLIDRLHYIIGPKADIFGRIPDDAFERHVRDASGTRNLNHHLSCGLRHASGARDDIEQALTPWGQWYARRLAVVAHHGDCRAGIFRDSDRYLRLVSFTGEACHDLTLDLLSCTTRGWNGTCEWHGDAPTCINGHLREAAPLNQSCRRGKRVTTTAEARIGSE
jgi:hypothetical protein